MSEFTGDTVAASENGSASEAPTDLTDITEVTEILEIIDATSKHKVDEEQTKATEDEQGETKNEVSEAAKNTEEKPPEPTEGNAAVEKPSEEGLESEDIVMTERIAEEIEKADEIQAAASASEAETETEVEKQPTEKGEDELEKEDDEAEREEDEAEKEEDEAVQEEETKEEELTEGEKMLREIDPSKAKEEADTELDYAGVGLDAEVSHITLHPEELPEIRGLAALEYESPEDSQKEVGFDNVYLSKRRSMRPSMALKLIQDEEAAEKRRLSRKEAAKKTIEEEEEEEKKSKQAEEIQYSREELYSMHEKLYADIMYIRMKNKILQRKCADFFRRRKMEHALKEEAEIPPDALIKYEKKLDRLSDLHDKYKEETERIGSQMGVLQKERDDKYLERDEGFTKGVAREREIGIGLISTKTGKEIPDKVVDQLIRRQTIAAEQISQLRLKFINLRDEIAEKSAELKSLDNIGDDLSLMDYEQLKIENRAHSDKLEEKEEELTKLRIKCRNAVQIMAHVREKSAALDADIDVLKEEYEEVHFQYIEIRERLNYCKTERDAIRNKTMKLKAESGLLTKPKLLQDMETSMEEVKLYEKTLEKVKNEYNEKTQQIRNLRKNIAYEMVMSKKQPKEKKKKTQSKFYKVRPSLIVPKLPTSFFDRMAANTSSLSNFYRDK